MTVDSRVEFPVREGFPITYVPLFHYGSQGISESLVLYESIATHAHRRGLARSHWEAKRSEAEAIITREQNKSLQINEQALDYSSQVSVGSTYLLFLDQLGKRNLSPQQIFDFFKLCLAINTSASVRVEYSSIAMEELFMKQQSKDFQRSKVTPLLQRAGRHIPEWFHGSYVEYYPFLNYYSSFKFILHPELNDMSGEQQLALYKADATEFERGEGSLKVWGATRSSAIPDWVDEKTLPARESVEEELAADRKELELLIKEGARINRSTNFIVSSVNEKLQRNVEWRNKEWERIRIADPKLGDFITFMHFRINNDTEKVIQYYVGLDGRITDSEALALWVEDNLKTADIVRGGRLTETARVTLALLFTSSRQNATKEERGEFESFRETNKKGYNALQFNLGPFVKLLRDEDILLLDEFLDEQDATAGDFISFLADCITTRLKERDGNLNDQKLNIATREFRQFYKKFLRNNWTALFDHFKAVLFDESPFAEPGSIQEVRSEDEDPAGVVQELEEELAPLRVDHLSNWRVLYSTDQTSYLPSLVEVGGTSWEERERALGELFVREGTSNSIKVSSIIHALDWKIQIPPEVEQLTPAIIIKGERWKKIKRQNVRILYQMDPEDKTLIFFVYQKKGWSYDLPAV